MMNAFHDKIRGLGLAFTPDMIMASVALYAPLLPGFDEAIVTRDIKYGSDDRNRLDLFGASKDGGKRPVVVYIHGGGFVQGDKGNAGQPFYNNVGAWAAREGWLGVTATYRLAPANQYPSGVEDMAGIIAWLRANVAEHGGDPDKIILIGQSAGASHVGSYLASDQSAAIAKESLAGAILMSGVYDLVNSVTGHFEHAYYGQDTALFEDRSAIGGLAKTEVPCLFTLAENDPENFHRQAALLIGRWVANKGKWPDFKLLEANNHISPVHQVGGSEDEVGPLIKWFVEKVAG
jgi:triacylglycerol lipase